MISLMSILIAENNTYLPKHVGQQNTTRTKIQNKNIYACDVLIMHQVHGGGGGSSLVVDALMKITNFFLFDCWHLFIKEEDEEEDLTAKKDEYYIEIAALRSFHKLCNFTYLHRCRPK